MRKGMFSTLLVVLVAVLAAAGARAAEMSVQRYPNQPGDVAILNIAGDIEEHDPAILERLLNENNGITGVTLSSPGGMTIAALDIGRIIRRRGLSTMAEGMCASACGLIWLGGATRYAALDARVCFHATFVIEGGGREITSVGNALVGKYIGEMGFSDDTVAFATSAGPDDLSCLDRINIGMLDIPLEIVADRKEYLASISADPPAPEAVSEAKAKFETPPDAPAPASPPPAAEKTGDWVLTLYEHVDFWGGDKFAKGIAARDSQACADICVKDTDCKLFTFNAAQNRCYVKTRLDLVVVNDGLVSGMVSRKGQHARELRSNFVARPGRVYTTPALPIWQPRKRIARIAQCLDYCNKDEACRYLTFDPDESGAKICKVRRLIGGPLKANTKATSFVRRHVSIKPAGDPVPLDAEKLVARGATD